MVVVLLNAEEHFQRQHPGDFWNLQQLIQILLQLEAQVLSTLFVTIVVERAGENRHIVVGLELEVGELYDLADGQEVIILLVGDDLSHLGLILL